MAGVMDAGVIDAEALTVARLLRMNDELFGLRNLVQQGNMIPGLNEVTTRVIRITQHSVALHSRVSTVMAKVEATEIAN